MECQLFLGKRGSSGISRWLTIKNSLTIKNWLHHRCFTDGYCVEWCCYHTTFHKVQSSFSLSEVSAVQSDLTLELSTRIHMFRRDIYSLPLGAEVNMMALLAYVSRGLHHPKYVNLDAHVYWIFMKHTLHFQPENICIYNLTLPM